MAIFKCKMCGGALEIQNNKTVVECEYCGAQQTLPKLDDEKRANMYDRANHFRRNNEFDKAMGIYDQILNEDNTDAEAYWSLVLCRYGIEYVEDPSSHKRVPTVNRAQFTSIFDDDNYKSALNNADSYQKAIYEKEAKAINEIQKGILAISQKEEPFDVFICYKETDNNGRRTPDSVLANDLYHQLTQEGFKVFFARITLEDKLGSAYEPYIFAALNSAKVMVALGTKPEYFNAVWVKNEWSRYLSLIKNGAKKMLIPAYKDMDPYDLPEEFSHLQAQDMSKLGFMQDLIRGIKKIIDAQAPKTTVVKETVISGGNANTAPLLKRAFMFLEDKEWNSADEYCEKVLDIDPECAEAYLGKLMVELNVTSRQNLKNCSTPFDARNNFQKAMRFADENLKKELQGYIDFIINRNLTSAYNDAVRAMKSANTEEAYKKASAKFKELHDFKDSKELAKECLDKAEEARLTVLYNSAVSAMNSADTEQQYKSAAGKFSAIKTFRDAEDMAKVCLEKAEISRKDAIYDSAVSSMSEGTISAYKKAIDAFKTIEGWKDSSTKIYDCERSIYEIEQKEEADRIEAARLAEEKRLEEERIAEENRIEAERLAEEKRIADAKAAKKRKIIIAITTPIVCACIAFVIVLNTVIIPNGKYEDALALMESGKYEEAIVAFENLDGYKDSAEKIGQVNTAILDIKYNNAVELMSSGRYEDALEILNDLGEFKEDIAQRISICQEAITENSYQKAEQLYFSGNFKEAMELYLSLGTYKESNIKAENSKKALNKQILFNAKIGDTVLFGSYEQNGNTADGNEDIEWYVISKENGKVMLLSKNVLDMVAFSSNQLTNTWDNSTIRTWANSTFYNSAFSDEEKKSIITTRVSTPNNPSYGTSGGSVTNDKIFLLSIQETQNLLTESQRCAIASKVAFSKMQSASQHYNQAGECAWFLRSPVKTYNNIGFVSNVGDDGLINGILVENTHRTGTRPTTDDYYGFRPAMWVTTN